MPSVATAPQAKPSGGRRDTFTLPGCRDPNSLVDAAEGLEAEFVRLAYTQSDDAVKRAFLDMAAVYHRANKDVGRLLRDVRG